MDIAGIVVLLIVVALAVLFAIAATRTVRSVKRSVSRGAAQARRVVEDTQIKARSYTMPGPAGRIAQLRLSLRASIDSTFHTLEAERGHDASLSEAAALFARLNEHARALDIELKFLEREPDKSRLAARLPDATERVTRITHAADTLRWAAQDRASQFAADDLATLARTIDIEAAALRHWSPAHKLSPPGI